MKSGRIHVINKLKVVEVTSNNLISDKIIEQIKLYNYDLLLHYHMELNGSNFGLVGINRDVNSETLVNVLDTRKYMFIDFDLVVNEAFCGIGNSKKYKYAMLKKIR